jgi:hypothetical protein
MASNYVVESREAENRHLLIIVVTGMLYQADFIDPHAFNYRVPFSPYFLARYDRMVARHCHGSSWESVHLKIFYYPTSIFV